jgi:hypothetical protein
MLLTVTTTHKPATDLGYLLRKNPARPQLLDLSLGKAHVFYSEASNDRCAVALLVEVDPAGLVRNRRGPSGEGAALEHSNRSLRCFNIRPHGSVILLKCLRLNYSRVGFDGRPEANAGN